MMFIAFDCSNRQRPVYSPHESSWVVVGVAKRRSAEYALNP
jgi:hypothetical protein